MGGFVLSLAGICPVVLEKKVKMLKVYDDDSNDRQRIHFEQINSLESFTK